MIEEDQAQAEARQSQESQGDQDQAQPGFFTAAEAFPAVDVLGLAPGEEAGLFDRALGHQASVPRHCLFFHASATPAARPSSSRASNSSPVFQMSPAPRVRTRAPTLR